jgi:putative membrane protein
MSRDAGSAAPGSSVITMRWLARFLVRVVVLGFIIFLVTKLVPGIKVTPNNGLTQATVVAYLWVALLFAVINSIVGPVIRLLSLPFVILTLGLFLLVINAALLGITAGLSDHLSVSGFGAAVVGGFLIALFSWAAELILPLKVK